MLPEVASTMVPPAGSWPLASAASTMATPIRSFTEAAGLANSSFAATIGPLGMIRLRRTNGVFPTVWVTSA